MARSRPTTLEEGSIHPTFQEVFDAHARYVWRTLRWLGVPEQDLDDFVQEVFLVVHRKLAGFEGRSRVRTWLYGICLRVVSDFRRRPRREVLMRQPPELSVPPVQDVAIEQREAFMALSALLDRLDDHKRAVFVLYEIERLPMAEVAQVVGCPLQTAYSRLHAARRIVLGAWEGDVS